VSLWLHFGCGPNKLEKPWNNFDREVNIASLLPFGDNTAQFIYAEHVIEHVSFLEGMSFLGECKRVLEPGGVLRFAFPDVTRFNTQTAIASYLAFLKTEKERAESLADIFRFIMLGSRHRACWSRDIAEAAVTAIGFRSITSPVYGESTHSPCLVDIEGHHKTSPVARLETTIIEAAK
jgi:hypothetical protein